MKNLFRKLFASEQMAPNLELISVHVPKTAGTSFRNILERIYHQEDAFQPIYKAEGEIWHNRLPNIPEKTRVIHGHFPATMALHDAYPQAKIIAWAREPVARTISYYSFWKRTPKHGNPAHDYFLDNDMSLIDFARHPVMQGEMLAYFDRVPLEKFFFIGLVEHFDEDIRALARSLDWPEPEIPKENVTKKRLDITDEEHAAIEEAMADTIALYEQIKQLRAQRLSS